MQPANQQKFEFPRGYRIGITIISSIFSIGIIAVYIYLIIVKPDYLEPEKFGLSALLIFFLTLLLFFNFPLEKLGLRIKKIGIIELEEKVEGQAKNVAKDIADLQVKIDELEKKIGGSVAVNKSELEPLLLKFLKQYDTWAFSASRIKSWGANQPGYDSLNTYSIEEIKTELRRLLAKNMVSTRISKKGNVLYRYYNQ